MFTIKKGDEYLTYVNPKCTKFSDSLTRACKWKKRATLDQVLERFKSWGHDISQFKITEENINEVPKLAKTAKEPKPPKKPKLNKEEKRQQGLKRKNLVEREYSVIVTKTERVISIAIPECPHFRLALRSWDDFPKYFKWINMSNLDTTYYKDRAISERCGGCADFSPTMNIPGDTWGSNIPDELRSVIKSNLIKYLVEIKEDSWTSSSSSKIFAFPMNAFLKLKTDLESKRYLCKIKKTKIRNEDFKIVIEPDPVVESEDEAV